MMGMTLRYISSNGMNYVLKCSPFRTRTADYHNYQWKPQVINRQYGADPYRFDKDVVTYETTLSVFGSLEERRDQLNKLHAAFDHDIVTLTPGRLLHGLYYIDCYITASSTYYDDPWTQNTLSIYCPYPFWRRDIDYNLKAAEVEEYEFLDFEYEFPYDYMATLPGFATISNPGVKAADWEMRINGYALNPLVVLGGMSVGVNAVIGAEETLIISSRNKTVKKVNANGIETNLFNQRLKTNSIFEPLASGDIPVLWSGAFDVKLTVFEERSEPLWI